MERPRLRAGPNSRAPTDALHPSSPQPQPSHPIPPLKVKGVVVTKADLVEALRIYIPQLSDFQPFEDGEHFMLVIGTAQQGQ